MDGGAAHSALALMARRGRSAGKNQCERQQGALSERQGERIVCGGSAKPSSMPSAEPISPDCRAWEFFASFGRRADRSE